MGNVSRSKEDVKSKRARIEELMNLSFDSLEIDAKLQLIHELIPLGLLHIQDILQEEVRKLAGERYKRNGLLGYDRWGKQWGSVYIGEAKVPIRYPRVRDKKDNKEIELRSYRSLQEPRGVNNNLLLKVLHGISCRRYKECCKLIPEVFGMSPSTISRRFIRASTGRLKEFMERRLEEFDIIAIIIDGKTFHEDEMIIALGVTMEGKKVVLGFIQAGTENALVCRDFLNSLLDRGLKIDGGVLCVIDGSKGIRKAVKEVFGGYAVIQRCQWHKRENVVSYLAKGEQDRFSLLLQKAYEESTYERAKSALGKVRNELLLVNESAVKSLEEGIEETLTLHRLGVFDELGKSLKTTNCIESVMALIGQKTDKVDWWKSSNQLQRWLATVILDLEPRLNRIRGYRFLSTLRSAIQRELGIGNNLPSDTIVCGKEWNKVEVGGITKEMAIA